ncbi:hypothetical protein B4168_2112 [Anoxybacillus flavithermus]|nr:hypothetical protein B4168_2112 [Anoxybacillus flavithermus]OAO85768.1 hypothetical protein GT23_2671 [Parageobacillus thermoglucosidasius]
MEIKVKKLLSSIIVTNCTNATKTNRERRVFTKKAKILLCFAV